MKKILFKIVVMSAAFQLSIVSCTSVDSEVSPEVLKAELSKISDISVFTDIMTKTGNGLLNTNENKTLFIPTDEAFEHYDIKDKRDYDKATLIAFLASQMTDSPLASANFKSGKLTLTNTDYVRVYDGRAFTQIEDALIEKTDLKVGNLTVHLVDRLFFSKILVGHEHSEHASGGEHAHDMKNNCGDKGPSAIESKASTDFRTKTSQFLETLPTWNPNTTAPFTLPNGFTLMGGRNDRLPYIHYFSKQNMEDNKFMNPSAPEGLMCGLTADGIVFPISAVYITRDATSAQLHDLNCIYMFHEHDGLPGTMMHVFHNAYPSTNNGYDHEADPLLVRQMKIKK